MTTDTIELDEPKRSARVGDSRIQQPLLLLEVAIPSDPRLVDGVVEEIRQVIDGTAYWGDVEGIGLAVREALANAIIHGNRCDPEKIVGISVAVNENCDLLVVVKDSGPGFDPRGVPNPTVGDNLLASHGRGIFLIQQFMDQVDFKFDQGTEVYMRRRRQWIV